MSAKTVLRHGKLKGMKNVRAALAHNSRRIPPAHSSVLTSEDKETLRQLHQVQVRRAGLDPVQDAIGRDMVRGAEQVSSELRGQAVQRIHGGSDEEVMEQLRGALDRVEALTQKRVRKDAVLAVEVLLSASAAMFRPGDPGAAGDWDDMTMRQWRRAAVDWALAEFGDRILSLDLHLDESTPHIQILFVPLTKDLRLSAKEVMSKGEMIRRHSDYAGALQKVGLDVERGEPSEGAATHTSVKEYYRVIQMAQEAGVTPAQIRRFIEEQRPEADQDYRGPRG